MGVGSRQSWISLTGHVWKSRVFGISQLQRLGKARIGRNRLKTLCLGIIPRQLTPAKQNAKFSQPSRYGKPIRRNALIFGEINCGTRLPWLVNSIGLLMRSRSFAPISFAVEAYRWCQCGRPRARAEDDRMLCFDRTIELLTSRYKQIMSQLVHLQRGRLFGFGQYIV